MKKYLLVNYTTENIRFFNNEDDAKVAWFDLEDFELSKIEIPESEEIFIIFDKKNQNILEVLFSEKEYKALLFDQIFENERELNEFFIKQIKINYWRTPAFKKQVNSIFDRQLKDYYSLYDIYNDDNNKLLELQKGFLEQMLVKLRGKEFADNNTKIEALEVREKDVWGIYLRYDAKYSNDGNGFVIFYKNFLYIQHEPSETFELINIPELEDYSSERKTNSGTNDDYTVFINSKNALVTKNNNFISLRGSFYSKEFYTMYELIQRSLNVALEINPLINMEIY